MQAASSQQPWQETLAVHLSVLPDPQASCRFCEGSVLRCEVARKNMYLKEDSASKRGKYEHAPGAYPGYQPAAAPGAAPYYPPAGAPAAAPAANRQYVSGGTQDICTTNPAQSTNAACC